MIKIGRTFFIFLLMIASEKSFAIQTSSYLLGGFGSVLVHEAGHALTTLLLDGKVLAFKPYPTKVLIERKDKSYDEEWVLGLVKYQPFEGEDAKLKNAMVSAMGSGAGLIAVIVLAPALTQIQSIDSKNTLDALLSFSSFDMAAYTTTDWLFNKKNGDWRRVSELTEVSLHWYVLAGWILSGLVNEYRYYWRSRSVEDKQSISRFSVGFSLNF